MKFWWFIQYLVKLEFDLKYKLINVKTLSQQYCKIKCNLLWTYDFDVMTYAHYVFSCKYMCHTAGSSRDIKGYFTHVTHLEKVIEVRKFDTNFVGRQPKRKLFIYRTKPQLNFKILLSVKIYHHNSSWNSQLGYLYAHTWL